MPNSELVLAIMLKPGPQASRYPSASSHSSCSSSRPNSGSNCFACSWTHRLPNLHRHAASTTFDSSSSKEDCRSSDDRRLTVGCLCCSSVEGRLGAGGGFCMLGGGRGEEMLGDPGMFVGVEIAAGLPTSVFAVPECDPAESKSSAVLRAHGNLICLFAQVPNLVSCASVAALCLVRVAC